MSDTNDRKDAEAQQTRWLPIISDMLILVAVMGCIGYLCNLIMKPFEKTYPTDSLVSLILKGGVQNDRDDIFAKELADGIEKHADFINTGDLTGRTPLMWAVYANFNDPSKALEKDRERLFYVDALLKAPGIRSQAVDADGFTALHWAAWSGMPRCCERLVKEGGLDVNAKDSKGYTPLMLAALRGNVEVVSFLLNSGADASLVNERGETAASLAFAFEAAYAGRGSWLYKLIYSKERESFYKASIARLVDGTDMPVDSAPASAPDAEKDAILKVETEVQEGATEPTTIDPTPDTPAEVETQSEL